MFQLHCTALNNEEDIIQFLIQSNDKQNLYFIRISQIVAYVERLFLVLWGVLYNNTAWFWPLQKNLPQVSQLRKTYFLNSKSLTSNIYHLK